MLAEMWINGLILIALYNGITLGEFNPLFKFHPRVQATKRLSANEESLLFKPKNPIHVYGKSIDELRVYKNGWIALDGKEAKSPPANYPKGTSENGERLQDFDGRYLAVFTSVNDGPSGSVTIRDISLDHRKQLGCVHNKQLLRFKNLISLKLSADAEFRPQSMVTVTWENMTNSHGDKENSYNLVLLTNHTASYAIFQYWKIEWPQIDQFVSDALPPEAGVFVKPNQGFQLPRSGHSVNTSQWISESNVAVPGEWLILLHETTADTTHSVEQLANISKSYLTSLQAACPVELHHLLRSVNSEIGKKSGFLNDSPNISYTDLVTEVVDVDPYNYIEDDEMDYDPIDPNNPGDYWEDHDEDNNPPEYQQPTGLTLPQLEPHNTTNPYYIVNGTEMPEIVTQTVIPLGLYDGDETRYLTVEPEIVPETIIPLENKGSTIEGETVRDYFTEYTKDVRMNVNGVCDAMEYCAVKDAECHLIEGEACCICKLGYYGSGNEQCWQDDDDNSFAFRGTLKTSLGQNSFQLPVYLDVQNGRSKRSSSGIRNAHASDPNFHLMRLLTPIFHLFNALFATSCFTNSSQGDQRAYNIFTLSGGFRSTFYIQFYFDLDYLGKLTASAKFKLNHTIQDPYSRGTVEVELNSMEGVRPIQRVYRESVNAAETPEKTYYTVYHMDEHKRLLFPEQSVKFVAESRGQNEAEAELDQLNVRWSAVAMLMPMHDEDRKADCMLYPGSPIARDQKHYIKMLDRGYCSEDCSAPDGTCNLFCIDVPLLSATEPDACSCVKCPSQGEYCKVGRNSYTCECKPGLRRMDDHTCKGDAMKSAAIPKLNEQCGPVICTENARCIDPQHGLCQCWPGYRGDGVNYCENDPCARCQRNEICENDQCKPTGVDLCEGIRCGLQAFCRDGACVCTPGYTGDPMVECIEERDPCENVQCHHYGKCVDGRCRCVEGYNGDGYHDCRPHVIDYCEHVQCHPFARCTDGRCLCMDGYRGDGYQNCWKLDNSDLCSRVQCHQNAICVEGRCQCSEGFEGDGYYSCTKKPIDLCEGVKCHVNAYCQSGQCRCREGYEGDGYWECKTPIVPVRIDLCADVRCHPLAYCSSGQCLCPEGYQGDGYWECTPRTIRCENVKCHPDAICERGICHCRDGYIGDGYRDCNPIGHLPDQCTTVACHRNAYCREGRCFCHEGFRGDGYWECVANEVGNSCETQRCHPYAECRDGRCQCISGYIGDGYGDCSKNSNPDPCASVRCHDYATCENGHCRCRDGFIGDGYYECRMNNADLCAGVQCHRFGQCYENRCYCQHGYVGDGVNFCDVFREDPCDGVRCAANGECREGRCSCLPGYEGDGYHECRATLDRCANTSCHPYAQCRDGQCRCVEGYEGDGYRECRPADSCSRVSCHFDAECHGGHCYCRPGFVGDGYYECRRVAYERCTQEKCHSNAHCVNDRCECKSGYEGDGYTRCQRIPGMDPGNCEKCRGIPHRELAQCLDGQCICATGFIMAHPGVCTECVQVNCHRDALCEPNAQYNGAYSCQCKPGFHGDGVNNCIPTGTSVDPTCGGGCRVRNAECNPSTGRCECRRGYIGDGHYQCTWNCQQCVSDAICDEQNERCTCRHGFHGDGTMFCEPIPTRPDIIKVHITGQGDVFRVADLDKPLHLRCLITTNDDSITGQWSQPRGSQAAVISITRVPDGTENLLRIEKPALTDAGRYYCRAGPAEAFIDVAIEETAVPYDIFLTSDDGILKVRSSGKNTTVASIWNLAENNKYGRIAMTTDCNKQHVLYTSDYGHAIHWGDANANQKELITHTLLETQLHRFRHLAVDPPSGNIFAWDELNGQLIVLNTAKPHLKYSLEMIRSFKQAEQLKFAGLTSHSSRGLIYWAAFTDGWMPNGTIQVATMSGQGEKQLLQLSGEPLAISLSPSYDNTDNSAGRLCWIQRSLTTIFALTTEMHCARLSDDGWSVIKQERLRQFSPTEEPSWGMVHHRGTVLWADASKPIFYSANPARRVRVRHVCCSNRFQAISVLAKCNPAMSNPCGYSNGGCRHFCLPNRGSRECVCPDTQPGCHKEI